MLFLLNDQIFDVAAESDALAAEVRSGLRQTPTLFAAVTMGQQVIYAAGSFRAAHPTTVLRVAASIAMASEANAALFVIPPTAAAPSDVAVRLASAPLTTMSRLEQLQRDRSLGPNEINAYVWSLAAQAGAA